MQWVTILLKHYCLFILCLLHIQTISRYKLLLSEGLFVVIAKRLRVCIYVYVYTCVYVCVHLCIWVNGYFSFCTPSQICAREVGIFFDPIVYVFESFLLTVSTSMWLQSMLMCLCVSVLVWNVISISYDWIHEKIISQIYVITYIYAINFELTYIKII